MNKFNINLRRLCFTGPAKHDAALDFREGLNVIYGASDTGKSFVLEAIAFMFGGSDKLRDIPQRVGYDRIWLTLERSDGTIFTITRSTGGGDFNLFEGTIKEEPADVPPVVLKSKHTHKNEDNISTYLLSLIGANGKKLKKNVEGVTTSLTAAYFRRLCIISETDIQKQKSPILSGDRTTATSELAAFKFLLTGVDDSGMIKAVSKKARIQARQAKREMLEELLVSYQAKLERIADGPVLGVELAGQIQKLDQAITNEEVILKSSEDNFGTIFEQRVELRLSIESRQERLREITDLLSRFDLLDQHYGSDIKRLEGIEETGNLVAAIAPGKCPLCGSDGVRPHTDDDCDGNVEMVVEAAGAERKKVVLLRSELISTIKMLREEQTILGRELSTNKADLSALDIRFAELTPILSETRTSYQALVEKRAETLSLLNIWEEMEDFEVRRAILNKPIKATPDSTGSSSEIPISVIDGFAQGYEGTLKAWHFPDAERVHFDDGSKDFNIAGKPRGSRGKGMRAITHAAFSVALAEFCAANSHPHLGIVIMDSPLLAYREPDVGDEGILDTGLNKHFYDYLKSLKSIQVLVIENVDPPADIISDESCTFFTGNPAQGRAGFFPL